MLRSRRLRACLQTTASEVVKVEPPGGDPMRLRGPFPGDQVDPEKGGLFLALNLNKRSVILDFDSASGRQALGRLVAWAHIVLHSFTPSEAQAYGLGRESIGQAHPSLVVVSVTPFGMVGPCSEYVGTELTMTNAGGWASLCPMTHREPEYPPLKIHGHHCHLMAGVAVAAATLAVVRDVRRCGVGDYVDFSIQEYVASVLEFGIPVVSYHDAVATRVSPRSLIPWRIFEAKDGPIFLVCVEQDQWERLVEFMGKPEWTQLPMFMDQPGRQENQDLVHSFLEEYIAGWEVMDLYHQAQQHRICFAPVMTFRQIAESEHLRSRGFFTTVDSPATGPLEFFSPAALMGGSRAPIRNPAPRPGENSGDVFDDTPTTVMATGHGNPDLPLAGVRVVDMTWVWAGTFGAMNLAHLGADVIRIESSIRPDLYRRGGVAPEGITASLNTAGMFNQWNQGKRSVAIDLRSDEGIDLVKEFVAQADVLIQNFATGVMDRLGLGWETLREINPRLVMANISGYGQTGPYREYMGYGPATGPLTGISTATGYPGGGPEEMGVAMPDPTAGITACWAVVAALAKREETGLGEHIDVSLWEATGALAVEAWMDYTMNGREPERIGNRDPLMSPHGCFPCAGEDRWVSIACQDEQRWQALCSVVSGLAGDPKFGTLEDRKTNEDALELLIAAWTQDRDRWDVTRELQALGIAAFPTLDCADIINDEHLNTRGFIERLEHPEVGARPHTGIPWRLANRTNGVRRPAPCLGADTEVLLEEVLGYGAAEIDGLKSRGVLQ